MTMTAGEWLFIVVVGLLLLVSVVCNVLVILVVIRNAKLRNPTNILICNLSISDLILASVVLPQNLHDISHVQNYNEGKLLCRVVNTCPLLCIMTSIYSMMVISYERTQAIVVVSFNDRRFTVRTTIIAAAVIWLIAFTFCIPSLYEYSEYTSTDPDTNATQFRCGSTGVPYLYTVANGVGLLLVAYIIPLITLLYHYTRILLFFRSMGMFNGQSQQRGQVFQTLYKTRMTVVKMLILVAAFFIISWAPYFALLILEKITGMSNSFYSDGAINMLRIALAAFSTAYNFSLYVMYNPNFRSGLLVLFGLQRSGRCCSVKVSPAVDSGGLTHVGR